jgi:hypothetical protein
VYGLHHDVHCRVQQRLGRFWIEIRDQFRRAFEVNKEHRDLLTLAFQGGAGGKDLFGEILGSVGLRSRVPGRSDGPCSDCLPTLKAELGVPR